MKKDFFKVKLIKLFLINSRTKISYTFNKIWQTWLE